MKRLLTIAALIGFALVLIGVHGLTVVPGLKERAAARAQYEAARASLDRLHAERDALRARVAELGERVDAVELHARSEFRLIRPGERLEIIETP